MLDLAPLEGVLDRPFTRRAGYYGSDSIRVSVPNCPSVVAIGFMSIVEIEVKLSCSLRKEPEIQFR